MSLLQIRRNHYRLLHPRLVTIITSGRFGEQINLAPISWITPVAEEPPSLALAINQESLTYELIKKHGDFVVNLLTSDMIDAIMYAGTVSGRDADKFSILNLHPIKSHVVKAPALKEAIARIECEVMNSLDVGETALFVAKIVHAEAKEGLFSEQYGWDLRKVSLPLHLSGRAFTICRSIIIANPRRYHT